MNAETPAPRYEHFRLVYPSGTVVESYCPGGATLGEVRALHPMATVEVIEVTP